LLTFKVTLLPALSKATVINVPPLLAANALNVVVAARSSHFLTSSKAFGDGELAAESVLLEYVVISLLVSVLLTVVDVAVSSKEAAGAMLADGGNDDDA